MVTNIRRIRLLPHEGEVSVTAGETVSPTTILARALDASGVQILRASEVLGIAPEKLEEHLMVKVGSPLKRGTPLMRKSGLFGRSRVYRSPVDGYLHQVWDGNLLLERSDAVIELRAMMPGRVASIVPGRGAILETTGAQIEAIWDSGKDGFGKIGMATAGPEQELLPEQLGSDVHGLVLVAGRVTQIETLSRLEEFGARGLVVGSLPAAISKEAPVYNYPILATEGIGGQSMAKPIFDLLQQAQGRQVSLLAADAGPRPQRPEIIIAIPSAPAVEQLGYQDGLTVGTQVRILRVTDGPSVGRVKRIYAQPRLTELGSFQPGADVGFEDGKVAFIPLNNLDVLT